MINIIVQIIFFALQKANACKCNNCIKMTLKITNHGSNYNIVKTFYSIVIAHDNFIAQIILFALKKLITITIVFHISYQCAIM